MTGLFLSFVVIAWLCISGWLAIFFTRRIKRQGLHMLSSLWLFVVFMVLPVADEIIGGVQFRELCEENTVIKLDKNQVKGKKLKLTLSDGKSVDGYMVAIREQTWHYTDINDGEELISYKTLHAKGGWLIKSLKISETDSPLLFKNACEPKELKTLFKQLHIKVLYK